MRGITPVVSVVILLIIAVAVVGLAYGFITGFFNTVTGKAAIISGRSSCNDQGKVSIVIRNAGTGEISQGDISITRTGCGPGTCLTPSGFGPLNYIIQPEQAVILTENDASGGTNGPCGSGNTCTYDVFVGGVKFPTRADC